MVEQSFVVPDGVSPDRADKILAASFPEVSRSAIRRAIDDHKVRWANGDFLEAKNKLSPGDKLLVDLAPKAAKALEPANIPLEIIFEDHSLLVLNKHAGMVVHPGDGTGGDTLVHALLHHCGENGLSSVGAPDRAGIVHRLDKETSGVILVAKSDSAHHALFSQFAERKTSKEYLALSSGIPRDSSGSVTLPIGRHPKVRVKMAVAEHGKPAHTDWQVVESFGTNASLVRCNIHTGRTHQIRVHLSSIGHPVIGDETYGYKHSKSNLPAVSRILLHAHRLGFTHPECGRAMSFEAPLPKDFSDYLSKLRA